MPIDVIDASGATVSIPTLEDFEAVLTTALKVVLYGTDDNPMTPSTANWDDGLQPSREHIGQVGTDADVFLVSLSLNNVTAYATGDVLAETQEVPGVFPATTGSSGKLVSITVLDEDAQAQSMDIVFLKSNVSLGTENLAVSITDADAREIVGHIRIETADYIALGSGASLATKQGLALLLESTDGDDSLFIGAISRGSPTHTAAGVRLFLGIERN